MGYEKGGPMDKLLLKVKWPCSETLRQNLADYLGISANALSSKINLKSTDFNQCEILKSRKDIA